MVDVNPTLIRDVGQAMGGKKKTAKTDPHRTVMYQGRVIGINTVMNSCTVVVGSSTFENISYVKEPALGAYVAVLFQDPLMYVLGGLGTGAAGGGGDTSPIQIGTSTRGGGTLALAFVPTQTASYAPHPGEFVPCDTTVTGSFGNPLPFQPPHESIVGFQVANWVEGTYVFANTQGTDVFADGTTSSLVLSAFNATALLIYDAPQGIWYNLSDRAGTRWWLGTGPPDPLLGAEGDLWLDDTPTLSDITLNPAGDSFPGPLTLQPGSSFATTLDLPAEVGLQWSVSGPGIPSFTQIIDVTVDSGTGLITLLLSNTVFSPTPPSTATFTETVSYCQSPWFPLGAMSRWRTDMSTQKTVVFFGDDSVEGPYLWGSGEWTDDNFTFVSQVAQGLGNNVGLGYRGIWKSALRGGGGPWSAEWVFSGTWSVVTPVIAPYGEALKATVVTSRGTWTVPANTLPIASYELVWVDVPGGGNWSYSHDGGSTWHSMGQTILGDNGLNKFLVVPSTPITEVIVRAGDVTGVTNEVCAIAAIIPYYNQAGPEQPGCVVHNLGRRGANLAASGTYGPLDQSGLSLSVLNLLAPDVIVIGFKGDAVAGDDTVSYVTALETIITITNAGGFQCDFGFLNLWDSATNTPNAADFRIAVQDMAEGYGAAVLDLYNAWAQEGFTSFPADNIFLADNENINQAGHDDIATRCIEMLGEALGPLVSTATPAPITPPGGADVEMTVFALTVNFPAVTVTTGSSGGGGSPGLMIPGMWLPGTTPAGD